MNQLLLFAVGFVVFSISTIGTAVAMLYEHDATADDHVRFVEEGAEAGDLPLERLHAAREEEVV